MSKSKITAKKSLNNVSKTESSTTPQYSAISKHSSIKGTPKAIKEWLTSLQGDRPASRSASQGSKTQTIPATYGPKQLKLLKLSGPPTSCLKMCPDHANTCPWLYDPCDELAIPLKGPSYLPPPQWVQDIYAGESGYMPTLTKRDGRTLRGSQPPKRKKTSGEPLTWKIAKQYLPTLTVRGNYNRKGLSKTSGDGLATVVGGRLNPTWCEWYMGFPMQWTELGCSVMPKYRQWLRLHGKSLPVNK